MQHETFRVKRSTRQSEIRRMEIMTEWKKGGGKMEFQEIWGLPRAIFRNERLTTTVRAFAHGVRKVNFTQNRVSINILDQV